MPDVMVEANDVSALARLSGRSHAIGPYINVYNEGTLRHLAHHGATAICVPPELPLALLGLVVVHLLALHDVGSNNPDGVEIKKVKGADDKPLDGIPFHPYYTVKDIVGVVVFLRNNFV